MQHEKYNAEITPPAIFDQLHSASEAEVIARLQEFASPLSVDPPPIERSFVLQPYTGRCPLAVPFTEDEHVAIRECRSAEDALLGRAFRTDTAARDFILSGAKLPELVKDLRDRTVSVWAIVATAFTAYQITLKYMQHGPETFIYDEVFFLRQVASLPSHLSTHSSR